MLKRQKVKAIYKAVLFCDNCGRPMKDSGTVALTMPPKYIYECSECNMIACLPEGVVWEIEFEEDEENV